MNGYKTLLHYIVMLEINQSKIIQPSYVYDKQYVRKSHGTF